MKNSSLINIESIWLNKSEISDLFDISTSILDNHIRKIFEEGLLKKEEVTQLRLIENNNITEQVIYYNFDVIISIGTRINSKKGKEFTKWINEKFKEVIKENEEISKSKKNILYVEDKYNQIYKIAYLKVNNIDCNENNFEDLFKINANFIIHSKESSNELNKFLDMVNIDDSNDKNILGLFDFDSAYSNFDGLQKNRGWGEIEGNSKTGLFRKRNKNFKAMVLPVPDHRFNYASQELGNDSLLDIELYFTDDVLIQLDSLKNKPIAGNPNGIKVFKGQKATFRKKLFSVNKDEFNNFSPLFEKIEELFNL